METTPTLLKVLLAVIALITIYSIVAWIIMITYNNSIIKLNNNWKPMDFKVALFFTLFTQMIFRTPVTNALNNIQ